MNALGPLPNYLCGDGHKESYPDPQITPDDLVWMFWNIKSFRIKFIYKQDVGVPGDGILYDCVVSQTAKKREDLVCGPYDSYFLVCGLDSWNSAFFDPGIITYPAIDNIPGYPQLWLFACDDICHSYINRPALAPMPDPEFYGYPTTVYAGPAWNYGPLPSSGGGDVRIQTTIYKYLEGGIRQDDISIISVEVDSYFKL
jgi:hypothetical protein